MVALLDKDELVIGHNINGIEISSFDNLEKVIKEREVHIGVISVPSQFAQEVADRLVKAGVIGIWNFAPIKIRVPEHICIVNEDLSVGLSSLSFHLSRKK